MKPHFREDKATQAVGLLLAERGGRMSYMKLLKLLYLADREALLRWGRPITLDSYVSMRNGPVLSRTYDLVLEGVRPGVSSLWSDCISPPHDYEVELLGHCPTDRLAPAETELLREVFAEHGRKTRWELVEFTHTLPEWVDPGDSAVPITYADILRAGGRSASEIAEINEELEASAEADLLFGGG